MAGREVKSRHDKTGGDERNLPSEKQTAEIHDAGIFRGVMKSESETIKKWEVGEGVRRER